ncbi:uncharacterized protein FYW49_015729 [Xenentodon cancila]
MEEENLCTPQPDDEESVLHQPCQDSADHKYINGEQECSMLDETEMQTDQTNKADQDRLPSNTDFMMPEEAEEWEQSVWEMRPVSCTSPPFSFATVEWDMPDPSAETPQLVTDGSLANELLPGGVMSLGSVSPSIHRSQDINAELFEQGDEEEQDGPDSWLLISDTEWTGEDSEPCDSADVKELKTQEKEDSAHELLHSNTEISPRADSEEGDERSVTSDPVDAFEDIGDLECEVDTFVDVKPEKEQDVLLTGPEDSHGEPTSVNGVEIEEESEEGKAEEEQGVTGVSSDEESEECVSSLTDIDVSAEPLQTDDTGLATTTDRLTDLQQPELLEDKLTDLQQPELLEDRLTDLQQPELLEDKLTDLQQPELLEDKLTDLQQPELLEDKLTDLQQPELLEDRLTDLQQPELLEDKLTDLQQPELLEDRLTDLQQPELLEDKLTDLQQPELLEDKLTDLQQPELLEDKLTDLQQPELLEDKLTDLQQPELLEDSEHSGAEEDAETLEQLHENLAVEKPESGMCKDEDHNVAHEQPEAADNNNEEALIQEGGNAEKIENSPEGLEVTEHLEEIVCLEQQECDQTASQDRVVSLQDEHPETEKPDMIEKPEQKPAEVSHDTGDQLGQSLHLDQSSEMEMGDQSTRPHHAEHPEDSAVVCAEPEDSAVTSQREQMDPSEPNEESPQMTDSPQQTLPEQLEQSERPDESEIPEQLSSETEGRQQTEEADLLQADKRADTLDPAEDFGVTGDGVAERVVANGEQRKAPDTAAPYMNGQVDAEEARRLAERLFKLDGIQRAEVVKHIDKDNDSSRAVGEEYLKFFDFTGQTLDHALRSFLKVVILIGETQERERVLQHFSSRFHHCNPNSFSSLGAVLALTCALMLLNTDLHGQHVGKSMSSSKFVSNLDGMNEGENFSKDLLKSLYNSIKSEPLEWAVDEQELKNSVLLEEDAGDNLRVKANPFQDVPIDKKASVMKEGFLQRKLHADIDGKRTPWGKRGWKTFYGVLRGMVLYLQKDNYRSDQQTYEEVVSVHHSLAEQAADYTKKPHVFRLQTADWRVFLFQASSKVEMNSWISRINLASALQSSPPFPAAVGSQRRFFRPILPASQSAHTVEHQLQSHTGMLNSFKADLSYQQENFPPEGKKTKARDLEEHRVRTEYLHHEVSRYEIYIQVLDTWQSVKTANGALSNSDLNLFDKTVCEDTVREEEEEEGGLKKSHSSPSLELEIAPPTVIKVKRNISERRTYRKTIIPRIKKEA